MSIDKEKLKAVAEACGPLPWRFEQLSICKFGIRDDHGYIAFLETGHPAQYGSHPDREAKARFLGEMTPAVVLALIAENERLCKLPTAWSEVCEQSDELDALRDAQLVWLNERDQLKAQVEALSKEAGRYRGIRAATLKPRPMCFQTPLQTAAPNLLAALEVFMGRFDTYQQSMPIENQCLVAERDQARKAIALARGESAA